MVALARLRTPFNSCRETTTERVQTKALWRTAESLTGQGKSQSMTKGRKTKAVCQLSKHICGGGRIIELAEYSDNLPVPCRSERPPVPFIPSAPTLCHSERSRGTWCLAGVNKESGFSTPLEMTMGIECHCIMQRSTGVGESCRRLNSR